MVEQLEFTSEGECEKVKEAIIKKQKQFNHV